MYGKPAKQTNVLGMIGGVAIAIVLTFVVPALFGGGKATPENIDKELSGTATGKVIKERFAADYDAAIGEIVKLANDKSLNDEQRSLAASQLSASNRLKHANHAATAPAVALQKVLTTQADLLNAVETRLGASTCATLANLGPQVSRVDLKPFADQVHAAGAATMLAIADGRDNPVTRAVPTDADYDTLFALLEAKGITEDQVAAMLNETPEDSDCGALGLMMRSAAEMPGEAGDRVRAELVVGIVSAP